jgi:prepilin-type N-terminal cleavage/methylation domain-containing protein
VKKFTQKNRNRRGGFTLIELVMVIMILAIVAGLAVPIVGWLRRSANYSAQANTTAAIAQNMEFFRTTYGNDGYPDHLDSLVITGGSDPIYSVPGYTHGGHDTDLYQIGDLNADQRACLQFLTHVFDHSADKHAGLQGNPGNSAIVERTFDGTNVAIVARGTAGGGTTEGGDPLTGEGLLLAQEIYPDGIPEDVTLVAFGVGPNNDMNGRTMQSTPLDPRVDNSQVYGRYTAIFATYSPRAGRRAQLKGVVNAMGRTTNNALTEFWQSTAPE